MTLTFEEYESRTSGSSTLNKLEEEYKRRSKSKSEKNKLKLELKWITNLDKINNDTFIKCIDQTVISNISDVYIIMNLNLEKTLNYIYGGEKKTNRFFPKKTLYSKKRDDIKITKIIKFIDEGNEVCPPLIEIMKTKHKDLGIKEGHHRIALLRFLEAKKIPFIIKKTDLKVLEERGIDLN